MPWLLDETTLDAMAAGAGRAPITAEQCQQFIEARSFVASAGGSNSRILTTSKGRARIAVSGVMTAQPDIFAFLFGGGNTTYSEIIGALNDANASEDVQGIDLAIDSPGGSVDGLFEAMDAIASSAKPVTALVSNKAASAAYGLASQAGEIVANSDATRFGSVGTAAEIRVSRDTVAITSTNAPDKRPDPTTAEGQATIRAELDAIADLFAQRIAAGRGLEAEQVNANFGRGGMLMAGEALKRGMIDAVKGGKSAETTPANTSGTKPEANMDLKQLKAEHPEVFAAAVELGKAEERDRVSAHLELGSAYNAMDLALEAVANGTGFTALTTAKYLAKGVKAAAIGARQDDDEKADPGKVTTTATETETAAKDANAEAAILAQAFALCGLEQAGV